MLKRLSEQRRALTVYSAEVPLCPALPTTNQWMLIEAAIGLLEQFSQLTSEFSLAAASISSVIPSLKALSVYLKSVETVANSSGLNTMREHLISAMETRFERVYETCHYVVATALDPRYKCKYFSPATAQFATTEILKICALRQPPVTITASADQNKNS
jgi:hypothetical protein